MEMLKLLMFSIVVGTILGVTWRFVDNWWENRKS